MPETTAKSPYDMTAAELQAEIGRLQAILHRKVCGDPRGHTSLPITEQWQPSEECPRDTSVQADGSDNQTTAAERVANALEALTERCFNRNLFPNEVKAALAALTAWHRETCPGCPDCRGIRNTPAEDAALQ